MNVTDIDQGRIYKFSASLQESSRAPKTYTSMNMSHWFAHECSCRVPKCLPLPQCGWQISNCTRCYQPWGTEPLWKAYQPFPLEFDITRVKHIRAPLKTQTTYLFDFASSYSPASAYKSLAGFHSLTCNLSVGSPAFYRLSYCNSLFVVNFCIFSSQDISWIAIFH